MQFTFIVAATVLILPAFAQQDPAALFQKNCQVCHQPGSTTRAPLLETIRTMSPDAILASLESGSMRAQGASLTPTGRRTISQFLGKAENLTAKISGMCQATAPANTGVSTWNGWGVDDSNTRYQPAAMARLSAAQVPNLKLKWAFGFPGANSAFGQPTIIGGKLYLGSQDGTVYALDPKSGCTHWTYKASASVRTAIVTGPNGELYFGDTRGNVYALDSKSGRQLWRMRVDDHPMARVIGGFKLSANRLYVPVSSGEEVAGGNAKYECCTFRGSLASLDATTGKLIWKSYAIPDSPKPTRKNATGTQLFGPAGAAVWVSPTIDHARKIVYIGTGNGYSDPANKYTDAVIAFDLETGARKWSQQLTPGDGWNFSCGATIGPNCPQDHGPDVDIGASPILTKANGKDVLLVGQKSGVVYALDPAAEGRQLWQTRIGKGGALGGIQWGMATDGKTVFVALSDRKLGQWQQEGGVFALDVATGKQVWNTPAPKPGCLGKPNCSAAQMAAVTLIAGVAFSGSLDGHLRAYATADGKIIWDVDTLRDFETVNGVKARGGSISATGLVVVDGMAFINSGYGAFSGIPGNVLLAFGAE